MSSTATDWKLCLTLTGKERPKEFATKPGSGIALETLKRQSDDKGQDALAKEMAKLAGEWTMVSGEMGGQKMPEEFVKTGKRVTKGNETTSTINGQIFLKATFTIDPSKKPKTIDYLMTDGPTKGKTQTGHLRGGRRYGSLLFFVTRPGSGDGICHQGRRWPNLERVEKGTKVVGTLRVPS